MIKSTLYSILFFAISILAFSSCSGSDDVNYLVEGDWVVYERDISCPEGYEDLEARLKDAMQFAHSLNYYVMHFESGNGSTGGENGLEYGEEIFEKGTIEEGAPLKILRGRYSQTNYENIKVAVQNLGGSVGVWEYQADILDINREHMHLEQSLTADDIEKFCLAYDFTFIIAPKGATATLSTKAAKIN